MILRLKLYRFIVEGCYLSAANSCVLPGMVRLEAVLCVSGTTGIIFVPRAPQSNAFSGHLFWAFVSEHYRVTSFDELFRERTGARAAWSACLATSFVLLALLYFSRNDIYPRGLLVCDVIVLLTLTVMLHAIFA